MKNKLIVALTIVVAALIVVLGCIQIYHHPELMYFKHDVDNVKAIDSIFGVIVVSLFYMAIAGLGIFVVCYLYDLSEKYFPHITLIVICLVYLIGMLEAIFISNARIAAFKFMVVKPNTIPPIQIPAIIFGFITYALIGIGIFVFINKLVTIIHDAFVDVFKNNHKKGKEF